MTTEDPGINHLASSPLEQALDELEQARDQVAFADAGGEPGPDRRRRPEFSSDASGNPP